MRYEIAYGVGFDRHSVPIPLGTVAKFDREIVIHACNRFGGCNLVSGQGGWKDDAGSIVLEESRVLTINTEKGGAVAIFAEWVRSQLNQTAVIVTAIDVEPEFVREFDHTRNVL